MKTLKIILSLIILGINLVINGQVHKEINEIISDYNSNQKIDFYVFKNKNYKEQIDVLKKYRNNNDSKIRDNYYLWLALIGKYSDVHKSIAIEELINGLSDNNENVVETCSISLSMYFNKFDYTEKNIEDIKGLFTLQKEKFYVLNQYVNTKTKGKKDSLWKIYQKDTLHYDVIKLIGYLNIKELIPDFKKIITDFEGKWGYNYADYPLMKNTIEDYAESRVINPWHVHLSLAHMGDTAEINYCIKQFWELVENNKNSPSSLYIPFMKDLVFIMQPQIVFVFKKLLTWGEIDPDYVRLAQNCLLQLIKDLPDIGAERDIAKETLEWLQKNKDNIKLNRLDALNWKHSYL